MDPPELDELRQRARRRWLRMGLPITVVTSVGATLVGVLIIGRSGHRHRQHTTLAIVVAVAVILVVLALVVFMTLRSRRAESAFAIPAVAGLPSGRRRQVRRDLRQGTPAVDPELRSVEIDTARRATRNRWLVWMFAALAMLQFVNAALPNHSVARRALYVASGVMMLAVVGVQLVLRRRCRRFLAALPEDG